MELIVSRPAVGLNGDPRVQRRNPQQGGNGQLREPALTITDPLGGTHVMRPNTQSPENPGCRLQVKTLFNHEKLELVVTVMTAVGLQSRSNGQYRCPYAKIFLLPDRSEKSKRRTKTISNTNNPSWNQSFVYSPIRITELTSRILEVTVFDFDRFGANEFLGEVTIDLAHAPLDEAPEWHHMATYKNQNLPEHLKQSLFSERDATLLPSDHLSPPNATNRLSDSEISEGDYGEESMFATRERKAMARSWQTGDAASLSGNSLGSSSSPPPDQEFGANRRDVSPKSGVVARNTQRPYASSTAYPSSTSAQPARRRLPQVPPLPRGRGRGGFFSMDRGRRQIYGRPQPGGYSGNSGYSDTEMLNERHEDLNAAERHRQRLDRLRQERDQGGNAVGPMMGELPQSRLPQRPSGYAMSEPGGIRDQGLRAQYSETSSQQAGWGRMSTYDPGSTQRMFSDTESQPGSYAASQIGAGGYRGVSSGYSDNASQPGGYRDLPRDVGRFTDTTSQPGGFRDQIQRPGGYAGPPSGGYQDLRGYHDSVDDRSGYMSDRGGYSSDRGGYTTDQRGYNSNRGGYVNNRGGGFPSDRGGFVSDRGGYNSDRGGYNNSGVDRGGFNNSAGDRGGYRGWSRVERPEGHQRAGADAAVSTSGQPITNAAASPKGLQGETSRAATSVQFSAKPDAAVESSPIVGAGATGSLPKSILRTTTTTPTTSAAMEPTDGSLSDSQLGNSIHNLHKRPNPGMGKKSSSTSQLSDTGRQRRLGLIGQKRTTITVHRSEEVIPVEVRQGLVRQGTSVSSDGEPELFPDNVSESWLVRKRYFLCLDLF